MAQSFNMGVYHAPDADGRSRNQMNNRRAPGTLRKDGTQTVRFELPYACWCLHCKPHAIVGQGVRFNAVKAKVGSYYSTPIYSFRFRHSACGGTIEIRTDPKNTAYVVTEGGKARDYGGPQDQIREGEGGVPILTAEERERRRDDAFAQLEGKVEEKQAVRDNTKRIEELYRSTERDWDDPWLANKRMRTSFRRERKIRKREEDATQALKERLGTDIDLLPETEEDAQRAKLISFGEDQDDSAPDSAARRSLFGKGTALPSASTSATSRSTKESRKEALRRQLVGNTRAALNPFGSA